MLSHVGDDNRPAMVNIGGKSVTHRKARARAVVSLPQQVLALLAGDEIRSPKGPVFQTAIIAGTMAAKKTSELIPLCHPIPLEDCKISITLNDRREAVVECTAEAHHKTGVEMEVMTAAAVAALTIYDMCKGVSRDITIKEVRLLEKTGGKSGWAALPG